MDISGDSSDKISVTMDILSDFSDRVSFILDDFDMNTASCVDIIDKLSLVADCLKDLMAKSPFNSDDEREFYSKNPWVHASYFLGLLKVLSEDWHARAAPLCGMKAFPMLTIDEWHEHGAVACKAILQSFEQLLEQLHHPDAHLHFDMDEPAKSLCARVLTYFRDLCVQLSIENYSSVHHFILMVTISAEIAEFVTILGVCQSRLPEDGVQDLDHWIKSLLAENLSGGLFALDAHSGKTKYELEVLDDDLVGLGGDLKEIKERLLTETKQLRIIPITGMGGIGKTTLATRVYEDPEIARHFHVRAWTTVSQKYEKKDVLLRLLQSIAPVSDGEISKKSYEQLGELVCRRLRGRIYLIVVDDIWTIDDWDDIRQWFPDDKNDSCIVLTSRIRELGVYADPGNPPHCMNFLGVEDSWHLLCKKVFLNQPCPPELVNSGVQIAKICQGLPLAVTTVAGHLSKMSKTPDSWENVAKGVGSLIDGSEERFFDILSLSYNDLPQDLKSCFLYMIRFSKNSEVPIQKLTRLWTAAGFLQAECSVGLEEMAEKCLENLISRNLIAVRRRTFDGRIKTCGIHDLLWDLCSIKARQEGENIFGPCPIRHTSDDMKYLMSLPNTIVSYASPLKSKSHQSSVDFKQLRVLDVLHQPLIFFPDEITELVNLRYLALATYGRIPGSVCKLFHLETLINDHRWACPFLPVEIWLLPRLRHLHVGICANLTDPSSLTVEESCVSVLLDLQTLSSVSFTSCTKDVFLKVPNVKYLEIHEIRKDFLEDELRFNCLSNLVYLHELQNLKLKCSSAEHEKPRSIPPWNTFVPNIKQLTLLQSHLEWEEMNNLAMLPNLEVLKLKKNAFDGNEWEQLQVFPQLKFLLLQSLELIYWKANKDHFPNLQRLVIKNCIFLLDIPNDFGEIPTLQSIELDSHNILTIDSTIKVQMEQLDMGNEEFTVCRGPYLSPQFRLVWLAVVFIYMTFRLEKQLYQQDDCCSAKTDQEHTAEGRCHF